jgi:hypothetical protein
MTDAGFEDGADLPLAVIAQEAEDLPILSALLQDAVFPLRELAYVRLRRRFAILLSRFRWEDRVRAEGQGRSYERVQSLLVIHDVMAVRSTGFDPSTKEAVLCVLALTFAPSAEGAGTLTLTLSGGGAIALDIEALDATLRDVTRPHVAKSLPSHAL